MIAVHFFDLLKHHLHLTSVIPNIGTDDAEGARHSLHFAYCFWPVQRAPTLERGLSARRGSCLCPLWVKSRHRGTSNRCPLYPQKRTLELSRGMSALCQKETFRRALGMIVLGKMLKLVEHHCGTSP